MITCGLRWWRGYFHLHLMWSHWKTGQWCSSRSMIRKRYKTIEAALKQFEHNNGVNVVVMIFPAYEVSDGRSDPNPRL